MKIPLNLLTTGLSKLGGGILRNSPTILTTLGAVGVAGTSIKAVTATPRALVLLEKARVSEMSKTTPLISYWPETSFKKGPLTTLAYINAIYKPYLPAILLGVASIGCIVGSHRISLKRQAVLFSAYQIATTKAEEYQEKVIELFGKTKEKSIHDAIAKDHVEANPSENTQVIFTGEGEHMMYDEHSGRYFKSDIQKVRAAVNNINQNLNENRFVCVNDFYNDIGLPAIGLGSDLGWNSEKSPINTYFSSQVTDSGAPCLTIDFNVAPDSKEFAY